MGTLTSIEVVLSVPSTHRRELVQTLDEMQLLLAADAGVHACQLFEDDDQPNRFLWVEWRSSSADSARIMQSPRFRSLLGAIKVLGHLEDLQLLDHSGAIADLGIRVGWLERDPTDDDTRKPELNGGTPR